MKTKFTPSVTLLAYFVKIFTRFLKIYTFYEKFAFIKFIHFVNPYTLSESLNLSVEVLTPFLKMCKYFPQKVYTFRKKCKLFTKGINYMQT